MAKVYESYFTQKRKQFGKDWLTRISPNEIMNNAERILNDLIRGNFNSFNGEDMMDFSSSIVQNSVINFIINRYNKFNYIMQGLEMLRKTSPEDPNLNATYNAALGTVTLYYNLYNYIIAWQQTGDITYITKIMTELKPGPGQNNYGNYLQPSKVF